MITKKQSETLKHAALNGKQYNKIPLNVKYTNLIKDISEVNPMYTPYNIYGENGIDVSDWGKRKEAKLKDKYMKVKIRYSGDKLTLITGVRTIFRI